MRALLFLIFVTVAGASPEAFLKNYCVECHNEKKQKGERSFHDLSLPPKDPSSIILTQDVIDQLTLGDMPPFDADKQPSQEEIAAVLKSLTTQNQTARKALKSTNRQTVLRRLNRREYLNTVADLLHLDLTSFDPTTNFPRDQLDHHHDTIGNSLVTSGYLLDQYLRAADQLVEKALGTREKPQSKSYHFDSNFQQGAELKFSHKSVYNFEYLCVYEVPNTDRHEGGYAYIHDFRDGVPHDGLYEIKVLAHSVNRAHPYDPKIFNFDKGAPFRLGVVPGRLSDGILHHPQPIEPQLDEVTVHDGEPQWHTMTVFLNKGQTPRFTFPNGMTNCRNAFGKIARQYKDHWPKHEHKDLGIFQARRVVLKHGKMPHIRNHEVKVKGPLVTEWPTKSQESIYGPEGFAAENIPNIITRFASRAYRRPATKAEINHLLALVKTRQAAGHSAHQALRDALKAVLCSPSFLYLTEPTSAQENKLSPHDLAARLSYFLWSTTPDQELRSLADNGSLTEPKILRQQIERLLNDPRSQQFVSAFLDSWLNLRALGDMPPARDVFRSYYHKNLEALMKRETVLFTQHLIKENLPVTNFIHSDFTFVNQNLADHYKLSLNFAPKSSHKFRKVTLPDQRRGGLLGMGSVLTVTANGIETSPIVRGVWLLENFLGTPPSPPPDDVPAIDPDVRGTTTIRDQLVKHRENPACFQCHQRIDPPGFALENFDPVGQWRTHYPLGKRKGPKIDASAQLPNGQKFSNIIDYKKLLLEKETLFRRNLATRLLTHATGRHIEPLDRPIIDEIVTSQKPLGLRTLIHNCIQSEIFLSP